MIIIFWRRELCAAPGLCGGGGASLLSMAHYDRVGLALPRVVVCVVSTSGQVLSIIICFFDQSGLALPRVVFYVVSAAGQVLSIWSSSSSS